MRLWLRVDGPPVRFMAGQYIHILLDDGERRAFSFANAPHAAAAVVAAGQPLAIAQWLGLSVQRDSDVYQLQLNLPVIRALLDDYFARDMWTSLDDARAAIDFIVASRGNTLSEADVARLTTAPSHVHTVTLDAGHWLHVDAPSTVVAHLVARLAT